MRDLDASQLTDETRGRSEVEEQSLVDWNELRAAYISSEYDVLSGVVANVRAFRVVIDSRV